MRGHISQNPNAPSALPPSERLGEAGALRALLPYLWPQGEPGMRARVVISLLMLAAGKVATVYVPVLYKQAIDHLTGAAGLAVAIPIALLLACGMARILSQSFGELRTAVFESVAQRAMRRA